MIIDEDLYVTYLKISDSSKITESFILKSKHPSELQYHMAYYTLADFVIKYEPISSANWIRFIVPMINDAVEHAIIAWIYSR